MAIFQPTSIIPSSFTQGTVDVNDNMEISWQVNGNSAMTAFQIDFYLNDAASTSVYSTGRQTANCPFYGTDRFGRPQFFTYNAGKTWTQVSMLETNPFTNGNNYKFKITQFFSAEGDEIYTASPVFSLSGKKELWLRRTPNSSAITYVVFDFQGATYSSGVVYYNWTRQKGWIITQNKFVPIVTTVLNTETTSKLGEGTLVDKDLSYDFVQQTSFSTFITRTTPTLTIYSSSSDQYGDEIAFPNSSGDFNASIGYFVADYQQAQGDPIRWIRWQVATANNGVIGDILADTGDIYTPTLQYEFNGFFNGGQYAIRCLGESESGQQTHSNPTSNNGWIYFNINIENQGDYNGNLTVQCLHKENATLLEWEGVTVIPPTVNPEGYNPIISNGSVILLPKNTQTGEEYSINWNKEIIYNQDTNQNETIPINFSTPWSAVWKGKHENAYINEITKNGESLGDATDIAFSPDGSSLVVGIGVLHIGTYGAYIYSVNGTTITYVNELTRNGESLPRIMDMAFSPDGSILIVATEGNRVGDTGFSVYSVNGTTMTYVNSITKPGSSYASVGHIAFSPDGKTLIISDNNAHAYIYSVNGTTITYVNELTPINNTVTDMRFSPDGSMLIVAWGGAPTVFSVNDTNITLLNYIDRPGYIVQIQHITFSPDGKVLVTAGADSTWIFSVNGTTITYVNELTRNGESLQYAFDNAFSPNGKTFIIATIAHIFVFSVNGTTITYVNELTRNGESLQYALDIVFSPDGNLLISPVRDEGVLVFSSLYLLPNGNFFEVQTSLNELVSYVQIDDEGFELRVYKDNDLISTIPVPLATKYYVIIIMPNLITAYFYTNASLISVTHMPINYMQQPLTSISIYGGNTGSTVESISVYQGDGSNVFALYENPNFEPVWNSTEYDLYMTANFNRNLEGGTGTTSGAGFRVYRQEIGKNVLTPIATVTSTTTSIKDYGTSSRKAYKYSLYAYDNNGAFMNSVEVNTAIATSFKSYSLLVCDYDETNDEYHVHKQYLFALNLSAGSVGNNNSPTLNKNFTQYPTRMPDTANYASGTLQGLIGAIYTVPALIEQIGQYKYTAKPSTLDYFDSVDLEKELYDLSTAPYQLFLRDMKGRLRMIATNGAISMTTNIKQKQQSISISFPWVEVGDASDVTIIQTPDDYGWNNDNQVLDVQLDVDVETGELSATYPFPYNGTKFYLTGVNKENLTAKTPLGVTPAQFNLSDTATQTTDGEVTATVTVNSEVNK